MLSKFSLGSIWKILSYSSFEDLVQIEAACNGTIRDVLRSETGCRLLEDLIAHGGIVIENRGIASKTQLKTLLRSLGKSSGDQWVLEDAQDVAHAVASANILIKSCLWPEGRLWSRLDRNLWSRLYDRPQNRWSSHLKRALFTMPQDAVQFLIDMWERRQVTDLDNVPIGVSLDDFDGEGCIDVESNKVDVLSLIHI